MVRNTFLFIYFRIKICAGAVATFREKKNKQNVERRSKVEAGRKWKHKHYWCNKKKSAQESDNLCLMYIACKIEVSQKKRREEEDKNFFFLSFHSLGASCTFTLRKVVNYFQKATRSKFRFMLAIFGSLDGTMNTCHVRVEMCLVWGRETFLAKPSI